MIFNKQIIVSRVLHLELDMELMLGNKTGYSSCPVGCLTGKPEYSMGKMARWDKLLAAPADQRKQLDERVQSLKNWELTESVDDPKKNKYKAFIDPFQTVEYCFHLL